MGSECALACMTTHLPEAEQSVARYKLRIGQAPQLPIGRKPDPEEDGPDVEPSPWMWVNPNIVLPPRKLGVPEPSEGEPPTSTLPDPQPASSEEDSATCSEAGALASLASLPPSPSEQSAPRKHFTSSPCSWESRSRRARPHPHSGHPQLPEEEEEETQGQDGSPSAALPTPHNWAPLQSQRLRQGAGQEGRRWSRPPLNYFHLIALALRNSSPCGLNVQQIYGFTRQHFPFFRTAPEGWKNTIRHNLCFRDSFEKVPAGLQSAASPWPRSCLWKLTEEGHRRFEEEARALPSVQLKRIQQCMSQPDMMSFLFGL